MKIRPLGDLGTLNKFKPVIDFNPPTSPDLALFWTVSLKPTIFSHFVGFWPFFSFQPLILIKLSNNFDYFSKLNDSILPLGPGLDFPLTNLEASADRRGLAEGAALAEFKKMPFGKHGAPGWISGQIEAEASACRLLPLGNGAGLPQLQSLRLCLYLIGTFRGAYLVLQRTPGRSLRKRCLSCTSRQTVPGPWPGLSRAHGHGIKKGCELSLRPVSPQKAKGFFSGFRKIAKKRRKGFAQ